MEKQHATLEIYHVDSHRLAFYLDADGQLVPLIQRALKRVRVRVKGFKGLAITWASAGSGCPFIQLAPKRVTRSSGEL